MARSFNGTSDFIANSGAPAIAAFTFTFACRVNLGSQATEQAIFGIGSSTGANQFVFIDYRGDSGGSGATKSFQFKYQLSGTSFESLDTARNESTGAWLNLVGIFTGTTIDGYVNNTHFSTSFAVQTFSSTGLNRTSVGAINDGSATPILFLNGSVADCAIWNVGLTTFEIAAFTQGARPNKIRPNGLIGWYPLDGLQSPELDLSGSKRNGTLTGTALAFGPPYAPLTPRWPVNAPIIVPPAAVSSFLAARAMRANQVYTGYATQ